MMIPLLITINNITVEIRPKFWSSESWKRWYLMDFSESTFKYFEMKIIK